MCCGYRRTGEPSYGAGICQVLGYVNANPAHWLAFVRVTMLGDNEWQIWSNRAERKARRVCIVSLPTSTRTRPRACARVHSTHVTLLPTCLHNGHSPFMLQARMHKVLFNALRRVKTAPSCALRAAIRQDMGSTRNAAHLIRTLIPQILHSHVVTEMSGYECVFCSRLSFECSRPLQWNVLHCCWCLLPLPLA